MLGRVNVFIANLISSVSKKIFPRLLITRINIMKSEKIDLTINTLCGKNGFNDLILTIFSFVNSFGVPKKWNVYSDGTLTVQQIGRLKEINFVDVLNFKLVEEDKKYAEYLEKFPSAIKLFILKYNNTTRQMFCDSDIVFFPKIKEYLNQFKNNSFYITDVSSDYLDASIIEGNVYNPLNFGFIVLNDKVDFVRIHAILDSVLDSNQLTYWTDQSICNVVFKEFAFALPYNEFLTGGSDAFLFRHNYHYKEMCLRHFVGPVRHKMWQYNWINFFER